MTSHHRKHSSIVSISTNVAGNADKIERYQAFNQWRFVQGDLYHDFIVTGMMVHLGDSKESFILECTSPGRHWLCKKTLAQFRDFQAKLETVFPVEAGKTGRLRVIPKLPRRFIPVGLFSSYFHRKIETFLNDLITLSPLIARSRIFGDFLMDDFIEEMDEAEALHGVHISLPVPQEKQLKCITNIGFFKWKVYEGVDACMTAPILVSVDDIYDAIKTRNVAKLNNFIEIGFNFNIPELQNIWNVAGTHQMFGNEEFLTGLTKVRKFCLRLMEEQYRKPWDESVYKTIIAMYLELGKEDPTVIGHIEQVISSLKSNCPFMSRADRKHLLHMEADLALLKGANEDELIRILLAFKTANVDPKVFASKIVSFIQQQKAFELAEKLEATLPATEYFHPLQTDLLNSLTEMALEASSSTRTKAEFSKHLTKAIQFNMKSMKLKPNAMAYFEFLKITKLQSSDDFNDCVRTCLTEIKANLPANENVQGKLQILRLIGNEASLGEALQAGFELFRACDYSRLGVQIVEGLIDVVFDVDCTRVDLQEKILEEYEKVIISDLHFVKAKFLKLAERLIESRKDSANAERYLRLSCLLPVENDQLCLKTAKLYMKLEKYDQVLQLMEESDSPRSNEWNYINAELALINRNNQEISQIIESDAKFRLSEIYCLIKTAQKHGIDEEIQLKLLLLAKEQADCVNAVAVSKAILGLYYDVIVSNGLSAYLQDFESILQELAGYATLTRQDREFIASVCWNVGLIHARADDFTHAQVGFYWAVKFFEGGTHEAQEAKFYLLSAKLCTEMAQVTEEDLKLARECDQSKPECKLLHCQLLIQLQKWNELEALLDEITNDGDDEGITFENVAEVILQSSIECPLPIHRKVLTTLAAREHKSIARFSVLFRGLCACALLIDDQDTCYFEEACRLIKGSFGAYPVQEMAWLCNRAHTQALEELNSRKNTKKATEWLELAMNLLYLLPTGDAHRQALTEGIQDLYHRL